MYLLRSFDIDRDQEQTHWLLFWLLAILLHGVLLLWGKLNWHPTKPAPVELIQIDSKKLETIKKQWQHEKALLLSQNQPKALDAPKDARYYSDRNIKVDRETRARTTQVIPQTGAKPQMETKAEKKPLPKLKSLGVPLLKTGPSDVIKHAETESKPRQEAQTAGEQNLGDKSLPEGAENQLNAQESVFYSFYARLYESIGPIWQSKIRSVGFYRRVPEGDYTTVVEVIISREGELQDVVQLQSSSIAEFDQVVPESWKKIQRFPNPPQGIIGPDGAVHMVWRFSVDVGQSGLRYMPPERID